MSGPPYLPDSEIRFARLLRSPWNIVRRLFGRVCGSCKWFKAFPEGGSGLCGYGHLDPLPLGEYVFGLSPKASCRRWEAQPR